MGAAARYLGVPGEQKLLGRGVSACATCDGFFFRDQDIAVVGGGDSAMEEATFLTRFARSVTIVHRRDEFRASRIMLERARQDPKIRWVTNAEVTEVLGDGTVTGLRLRDTPTGEESHARRHRACSSPSATTRAASWSVARSRYDEAGYVLTSPPPAPTRSIPGVFACGDLVDHTYRQAVTAAGSGCAAAIDAERWLAEGPVPSPSSPAAATAVAADEVAAVTPLIPSTFRPNEGDHAWPRTPSTSPTPPSSTDVLQSDKTVLVDFWAEWCGPCKMVAPVLDEIAGENKDKLTVAKLDIDRNPDACASTRSWRADPDRLPERRGGQADPSAPSRRPRCFGSRRLPGLIRSQRRAGGRGRGDPGSRPRPVVSAGPGTYVLAPDNVAITRETRPWAPAAARSGGGRAQ